MFKAQILRRSFSLFNRVPTSTIIKSAARDGHETVHIQRVRFQKPFFTKSRLLGTTIVTAGAYGFLSWLDQKLEDEEEEDSRLQRARRRRPEPGSTTDEKDEDEEEEDDDDDDGDGEHEEEEGEGLLFFPTGFSRPKPRTFYKGSDPEWQEYVRLAPDRQRLDRIRGELVVLVRDLAARNPQYVVRLGKVNPNAGSIWIEVKFPDGPPIEFERPGIELTEDLTLRKSTRPVHEQHHQRLGNLLFPAAVANSLYADSKRRAVKSWRDFRTYMGWEDKSKVQAPKLLTQFPTPPPSSPKSPAPTTAASSASTPPPAPSSSDTQQPSASSSPPLGNPAYERFGIALPDPTKAPTIDLSHFRQAFRKHHKSMPMQPPRGTVLVGGLIEIIGTRAKMTLDVTAAYDPRIGRYVALTAKLRSITQYKQKPKGGP